ncbi:MAG TPA: cupin domain-containing protein [Burkholderiaceae bacterium]|nr:cupin domain-containing protein [Burkholderiaceae bacterium]
MPKLDLGSIPERKGSSYPAPFDREPANRIRQRLGDAGGLTQFGVNLLQLPPGAWSSQRHWYTAEDEFVYVLSGQVALVTDQGEEILHAGDCVAFPANTPDGHHLINRSGTVAVCLEVGSRFEDDGAFYPDIDLVFDPEVDGFRRRDGTLYPK